MASGYPRSCPQRGRGWKAQRGQWPGADSFAAMFGSLIGTSTTTSYIESASGVAAGGRTGMTAMFVALFFILALFFSPLAGMVPAYATAAALLYVACVMAQGLADMAWD